MERTAQAVRYEVRWINHAYTAAETFATAADAVAFGKSKGFEFAVDRVVEVNGVARCVASWSPIGGLRWYDGGERDAAVSATIQPGTRCGCSAGPNSECHQRSSYCQRDAVRMVTVQRVADEPNEYGTREAWDEDVPMCDPCAEYHDGGAKGEIAAPVEERREKAVATWQEQAAAAAREKAADQERREVEAANRLAAYHGTAQTPVAKKAKKAPTSRPARWADAIERARKALEEVEQAAEGVRSAFEDLEEIRSEYEDWQGNLPENLQSSALGEKLEAVVGLSFDTPEIDLSEIESALDEAEGVDLPRGFGKD